MSSSTTSTGTTLQLQTKDPSGNLHNLPYPFQHIPRPFTRDPLTSGRVIFVENFKSSSMSMHNDGAGLAYRDTVVMFNGYPTAKLDTNGASIGSPGNNTPGTTPNTGGVVFKHRVGNLANTKKIGFEHWWYPSSANQAQAVYSTSIYIRDGVNIYIGRLFLDTQSGSAPLVIRFLNSSGTYTPVTPNPLTNPAFHTYDPGGAASNDRAGQWNYVKFIIDLTVKQYVSAFYNDQDFTTQIAGQATYQTADTGPPVLHTSLEYAAETATRRFVRVAHIVVTDES